MQFTPPGDSSQVSTITSDGDLHRRIRRVEMKPLMPASLKAIREQVAGLADECVRSLVDGNVFDAMEKIASYVPVSIVADMVGVRGVDAERLRPLVQCGIRCVRPDHPQENARCSSATGGPDQLRGRARP